MEVSGLNYLNPAPVMVINSPQFSSKDSYHALCQGKQFSPMSSSEIFGNSPAISSEGFRHVLRQGRQRHVSTTIPRDFFPVSKSKGFCRGEFGPHITSCGKVCLTPWDARGIRSPFLCLGNQAADMGFQENTQYTGYFWCPTTQGRDMQTVQTERFLAKGWPKLLFPFSPGKEFYVLPGNDRDSDSRQRWEDIISFVRDPPP